MASGLSARALATLLAAVFIVNLGFGLVLPLVPLLVVSDVGAQANIAFNTGLVTGAYGLAVFLFAPLWGGWSDSRNRRGILVFGLLGFAIATAAGSVIPGLLGLYVSRLFAGVFAGCILPLAQALVVDTVEQPHARAQRFAWFGIAGSAGLLGGPIAGGLLTDASNGVTIFFLLQGTIAVAAVAVGAAALRWLPAVRPARKARAPRLSARRELAVLIGVTGIVAAGLGAFEVALTIRADVDPALSGKGLGLILAECMLVMIIAQSLVFNRWVTAGSTTRLVAPALLVLGLGLLSLAWLRGSVGLILGTGVIAAASGILVPVLSFWISLAAGPAQGRELGRQNSIAYFGQAIGSALAGFLVGGGVSPNGGLLATGALLIVAALMVSGILRQVSQLAAKTPG
ncbi:MAG: MFS transporter [Sphingomicrobium sp.]